MSTVTLFRDCAGNADRCVSLGKCLSHDCANTGMLVVTRTVIMLPSPEYPGLTEDAYSEWMDAKPVATVEELDDDVRIPDTWMTDVMRWTIMLAFGASFAALIWFNR